MEGLDCRGQSCPQPVVETKKRLDSMSEGMLTVLVDNETARNNLLKLAASMNLDTSVSADKGIFAVTLRKTAQLPRSSRDDDKPAALLITAETMGRGSNELGALLMRSFFYALAEQDKLPGAIYLVNSAVRLACGGSDALDSLQKLSSKGVSIHSCGMCLDYFKLTEKLAVGDVTNMYAIVDRLMADNVLIL
jgi:selenium metabolism protein YedF